MVAMFLVSCATTSEEPKVLKVEAVSVGETLHSTTVGSEDCSIVVANVITLIATEAGFESVPPVVCGMASCPKSMPGTKDATACVRLDQLKKAE